MFRVHRRQVDESFFDFAGQPVRLTSVETTVHAGWPPYVAAAWTYRRPGHVSLGDTDHVHPIRDYGVITRVVLLVVALATSIAMRRFQ
jgi:hypothetical protein